MKQKISPILVIILCLMALFGRENSVGGNNFTDFSSYKEDFESVVNYVIAYPPHTINETISSYTIDLDEGFIEIDCEHQSPDSLNPAIKRIFEIGFTFIEVNEDCMIFWYDNMSYGILWTNAPVESLGRINEELGTYKIISDHWYETGYCSDRSQVRN